MKSKSYKKTRKRSPWKLKISVLVCIFISPKIAESYSLLSLIEKAWDELQRVHSEQEMQVMELRSHKAEMEAKNGQLKVQLEAAQNSAERQRKEKDQLHGTMMQSIQIDEH